MLFRSVNKSWCLFVHICALAMLHPGLASDNLGPEHPPNITHISRHFKFHTHSDKLRTRHLSGRHSSLYLLSPPLLHLLYDTPSFTYLPVIPLSLIIYNTLYPYHMIRSTWRATSITRHSTRLFHQTATEISAQLRHSPLCRARYLSNIPL